MSVGQDSLLDVTGGTTGLRPLHTLSWSSEGADPHSAALVTKAFGWHGPATCALSQPWSTQFPRFPFRSLLSVSLSGRPAHTLSHWVFFSVAAALTQHGSYLLMHCTDFFKIAYFSPLEPASAGQGSPQGAAAPPAPGRVPGCSLLPACPALQGSGWRSWPLDGRLWHNGPDHAHP